VYVTVGVFNSFAVKISEQIYVTELEKGSRKFHQTGQLQNVCKFIVTKYYIACQETNLKQIIEMK
jgi:hypothetical protein